LGDVVEAGTVYNAPGVRAAAELWEVNPRVLGGHVGADGDEGGPEGREEVGCVGVCGVYDMVGGEGVFLGVDAIRGRGGGQDDVQRGGIGDDGEAVSVHAEQVDPELGDETIGEEGPGFVGDGAAAVVVETEALQAGRDVVSDPDTNSSRWWV
jgi:hypothetical protein